MMRLTLVKEGSPLNRNDSRYLDHGAIVWNEGVEYPVIKRENGDIMTIGSFGDIKRQDDGGISARLNLTQEVLGYDYSLYCTGMIFEGNHIQRAIIRELLFHPLSFNKILKSLR